MSGHKKFSDLANRTMTLAARARVAVRTAQSLDAMPLQELRRARAMSQVQLAAELDMSQPEVSKIEGRTDMHVSTLRKVIEAMGGELEIIARFPDGDIRITQFEVGEP